MCALFGLINSPLCENTRCTGRRGREAQNVAQKWLDGGILLTQLWMWRVWLAECR